MIFDVQSLLACYVVFLMNIPEYPMFPEINTNVVVEKATGTLKVTNFPPQKKTKSIPIAWGDLNIAAGGSYVVTLAAFDQTLPFVTSYQAWWTVVGWRLEGTPFDMGRICPVEEVDVRLVYYEFRWFIVDRMLL